MNSATIFHSISTRKNVVVGARCHSGCLIRRTDFQNHCDFSFTSNLLAHIGCITCVKFHRSTGPGTQSPTTKFCFQKANKMWFVCVYHFYQIWGMRIYLKVKSKITYTSKSWLPLLFRDRWNFAHLIHPIWIWHKQSFCGRNMSISKHPSFDVYM